MMAENIDAKNYLRQVEMLDIKIKNKLIERQQWKDIALGITASIGGERVQSSGSKDKMAAAVVKCVDMEKEINDLIDALINKKSEVISIIEKLNSPTEYKILHLRYIQFFSLTDIAENLNKEYSWVTTTHGRALKNVKMLLDKQ